MNKIRSIAMVLMLEVMALVSLAATACGGGGGDGTGPQALTGSFFVSDAGQSHGGFEYTATWDATLDLDGSSGTLELALQIGLGDALTKHEFAVTDFSKDGSRISMKLDGKQVTLYWTTDDTVWDREFDNYYIASYGSDAPQNELRGTISPMDFPGLIGSYYVEMRFK